LKKNTSIKTKLILPISIAFGIFTTVLVSTAYILYSNEVTNTTNQQVDETCQQILSNYESYFDSVIVSSSNVIGKYSAVETTQMKDTMESYFDNVMSLRTEVISMAMYKQSDGSFIAANTGNANGSANTNEEWFQSAKNNSLINIFSRVSTSASGVYRFTLSKYVSYDKDSSYDAVLKVDYDFTKIVESIAQSTLGVGGRFTIYDRNYNVVYTSLSSSLDKEISLIKDLVIGSTNVNFENHSYRLYAATITNTTWRLAIFTNSDALTTAVTKFALYIAIMAAGMIVGFIVVISMVANSVANPIKELQGEMAKIESLNYETNLRPEIKGASEVVELNRSFNQMMGRIKELAESIVKEKEEQRKSELKALQNQINPHFLYNTLDSIIALIDKGENEKAEQMIVALSKFFRISISKGQNIIPLSDEIEHARNYLLIQKMRFGDSFFYDINVEPGMENYYVVKLILQPIVENSIGHGLKEGEVGSINIRAYTEGDFIKFEIKDNGYGMTKEKVEELDKSMRDDTIYQGVGLKNVFQRIRVYYGNSADVLIASEEDVGTTITIVIPKEGALKHEK
jgi:two-component system, sensor histidine kinase YesM